MLRTLTTSSQTPPYWIFDASGDYLTRPDRRIEPMDDLAPYIEVVKRSYGTALDATLGSLLGKDSGWHAQREGDESVTVERRFTRRVGFAYSPMTWAWRVDADTKAVTPSNENANVL